MWMMESHIVATSVRQMMAVNASTGTLTSSWREELIPSAPSRTETDLVGTTSAGQKTTNKCSEITKDIFKKMLTHTLCITQKPRWRSGALVFLQKGQQVAVGLLWCGRVSWTNRSVLQLQTDLWLWIKYKQNWYDLLLCSVMFFYVYFLRCDANWGLSRRSRAPTHTTLTWTDSSPRASD